MPDAFCLLPAHNLSPFAVPIPRKRRKRNKAGNESAFSEELPVCLDEGMFMQNFLKPKVVLNAATPAAVYLGQPLCREAQTIKCDSQKEVLCIIN